MSSMKHATISAWQRQEDGSYAAELRGWTLHVVWQPESPNRPRGFLWTAEQPGLGKKLAAEESFEEIEVAMAAAEAHLPPEAPTDAAPAHS